MEARRQPSALRLGRQHTSAPSEFGPTPPQNRGTRCGPPHQAPGAAAAGAKNPAEPQGRVRWPSVPLPCREKCTTHTFVFVRWSFTRPGVPTNTCGLLASAMDCAMMSTPPTSVAVRTPIQAPSASNCGSSHDRAPPPQSVARGSLGRTSFAAHLAGDLHGQLACWRENQSKERLRLVQERLAGGSRQGCARRCSVPVRSGHVLAEWAGQRRPSCRSLSVRGPQRLGLGAPGAAAVS